MTGVTVRPATRDDAAEMAAILNPIIQAGGTTAYEDDVDTAAMLALVFDVPHLICVHGAFDQAGRMAGFQWIEADPPGQQRIGYIATFARLEDKIPGAGRALFTATLVSARAVGLMAVDAKIRADNIGGLAYYSKMGFVDHSVLPGVPLKDGTPVDRIVKRLSL